MSKREKAEGDKGAGVEAKSPHSKPCTQHFLVVVEPRVIHTGHQALLTDPYEFVISR